MKAYISISFSYRKTINETVRAIADTLRHFAIEPFIFVDNYRFDVTQEREMMQQAMADIDGCDMFIAETSQKAIGVGVEAGYAKAKGKTVIYIRQQNAEHSTTVSGISDFIIVYDDTKDLKTRLGAVLKQINSVGG